MLDLLRDIFWRPRIISCRFTEFPVAGVATSIRIKSRNARSASLIIRQDDGGEIADADVPPNCVAVVTPLSTARMRVSLALEPGAITYNFSVTPRAIRPRFTELWMPSTTFAGHAFVVNWKVTDATGVKVEIDDGFREPELRAGVAEDAIILKPNLAGPLILRFTAWNEHARAAFSRVISVQVPRPVIHIDHLTQSARPGREVVFPWRITNATDAWLVAPARGERHRIGLHGSVTMTVGTDPEELQLFARGNGRTYFVRLCAIPNRLSGLEAVS